MLTRAGVAKKLGKSIATVRRMEGVELHPAVDERGVHWFDIREVEAIRTSFRQDCGHRLGMTISEGFRPDAIEGDDPGSTADAGDADDEAFRGEHPDVAKARGWAEQARTDAVAIREERERLERRQHLAHLSRVRAAREIAQARRALIDELESCGDVVLRRLTDIQRSEIIALLELEL